MRGYAIVFAVLLTLAISTLNVSVGQSIKQGSCITVLEFQGLLNTHLFGR